MRKATIFFSQDSLCTGRRPQMGLLKSYGRFDITLCPSIFFTTYLGNINNRDFRGAKGKNTTLSSQLYLVQQPTMQWVLLSRLLYAILMSSAMRPSSPRNYNREDQGFNRPVETGRRWLIHSVVCLTTGPQPPPKRVLHRVQSSASSFNVQYPLFSLRSSSSCLHLLPRLHVTSILPTIFPPATCFRRQ
jgi:hypothetical protein